MILEIDEHGWISVEQLIEQINARQKYNIDTWDAIVATDAKERYRYDEKEVKIKLVKDIRLVEEHQNWRIWSHQNFYIMERQRKL